jgi:hypothetical protein
LSVSCKVFALLQTAKGAEATFHDPGLVSKIDSTMINVNEASSRLNDNLEALKHNFLFLRIL